MAGAATAEPARAGARDRGLDASPQLPGERQGTTEPGDGVATGGAAGGAAARTQYDVLAAGFAPTYPEHDLDDPALGAARAAIDRVLAGHEPFPALAIDRYWTLVAANRVVPALLTGVAPELLQPPINVLRLSLHPDGLAAQIANLAEWRAHLLARLSRQVERTADPRLSDLLQELRGYARDRGTPNIDQPVPDQNLMSVAMPLHLHTTHGTLSLISTTMVFGTPVDVTLSELAIEAFFPADAATADLLQRFVPEEAGRP
jgi:hypothetical protein